MPIWRLIQTDYIKRSRVGQFNALVKCSQLENSLFLHFMQQIMHVWKSLVNQNFEKPWFHKTLHARYVWPLLKVYKSTISQILSRKINQNLHFRKRWFFCVMSVHDYAGDVCNEIKVVGDPAVAARGWSPASCWWSEAHDSFLNPKALALLILKRTATVTLQSRN